MKWLLLILLLPFVSAEYFNVEFEVDIYSVSDNNNTYSIVNIITENSDDNFTILNTTNIGEKFTIAIWRDVGSNQSDIENVTETLKLLIGDAANKEQCDYLLGMNDSINKINNTFYAIFDNVQYKSKYDTCESQKGTLNSQLSTIGGEKDTLDEQKFVYGIGGIILGAVAYHSVKGPKKIRQPGARSNPDIDRRFR